MRRTRAFTLVELLVVIGIIAVLISVLLPVLGRANRTARMTACLSNQKQLCLAVIMYCQENHGYFPGGSGYSPYRDGNGNPQPAAYFDRLANYDTDAFNPYSCNQDEQSGPTFLAKYVSKSKKIPACPEELNISDKGTSYTSYRTGYWYPMSLVYTPLEIWLGTGPSIPGNPQKPQKISKVKYPTQKCIIIDRKTYHCTTVVDTDKTSGQATGTAQNNTKKEKKLYVVAGFADGHAAWRSVYEMYDSDVNWTGRFVNGHEWTYTKGNAGILFKDFE
jgi:prepilin-type N-terminal cleavage/methylation domain-containing protein